MRFFLAVIIFTNGIFYSYVYGKPLDDNRVVKTANISKKNISRTYDNYLKGLYYIEKGEYRLAVKELEIAKAKDPASLHIRLKLATLLIRLGDSKEAEKLLQETKKIYPDSLDISLALIFLYSYAQKDAELENEYGEFLKNAHNAKPQDLKITEYLAQYYFYQKNSLAAISLYETILKEKPDYAEGLFWLGNLYDESGRRQEAISLWQKVLTLNSSYAPALNALGYIYAEDSINLDKAEEMVKAALVVEPENGAYQDSLGWIYFKKKNYKLAEEYLKKAIDNINDPTVYEHLGDLYKVLDDDQKAIKFYKTGINFFPSDKKLQEKIDKYGKENKTIKK